MTVSSPHTRPRASLTAQIAIGLAAGIATGLFLGERASFLEWPARAFVQVLQVTVLPFLVISLVTGIAAGSAEQTRRLFTHAGGIVLLLWALGLAFVFAVPLALPPSLGGAFYSSAAVSGQEPIDWIDLYIPSNPFRSLSNNLVPAVVVFSALLGVALLGLRDKERILGPLRLVGDLLGRAGNMLVSLTPIGIFAIAGHAAGTLRIDEFGRLQGYLFVTVVLHVLFTMWILPGLTSALTGIPYRRIVIAMWDPLITSFATANLFVSLPLIQERCRQLLDERPPSSVDAVDAVDVLVPTSVAFPTAAKLLSLGFIPFAAWYIGSPLTTSQWPSFAAAGVLSSFGSLNVAIPFLLDLLKLPADVFNLFVMASVITSRFASAAAVMCTGAFAVIGASQMTRRVSVDRTRLLTFAMVSVVSAGALLVGSRILLGAALTRPDRAETMFDRLHPSGAWGRLATLDPAGAGTDAAPPPAPGHRLDAIVSRGSLRVCVAPETMPWCYVNGRGELVGFEVDLAHAMAVQLNTHLTLVPVERVAISSSLASGACDMATRRVLPSQVAASTMYSRPVTFEKWAFLTLDHRRNAFASLDGIRQLRSVRIAVFREREWIDMVKARLPNAEVIAVDSIPQFINAPAGQFDAMFTGYDRALAYSIAFPQFSAVLPSPDLGSIPVAISVPAGEQPLLELANAIVDADSANGSFQDKLDYWIKGKGTQIERGPRWSIGRDVLGWWK